MALETLEITSFRNISAAKLNFSPHVNLITGQNGAGKSSILEAIYYLGHCKSFRCSKGLPLIQHQADFSRLRATGTATDEQNFRSEHQLGIELQRLDNNNERIIRLDQQTIKRTSTLAKLFPAIIASPNSYRILTDGPQSRRQCMHWGMFHVKHSFASRWRDYNKALKQYNLLLKQQASNAMLAPWQEQLSTLASDIKQDFDDYLKQLTPHFNKLVHSFIPSLEFAISIHCGWEEETLKAALLKSIHKDKAIGYASSGPHRSDLIITTALQPIAQILSQGQLKLTAYALQFAHALMFADIEPYHKLLLLIDDLPSELDSNKQSIIAETLHQICPKFQSVITGIDQQQLRALFADHSNINMFHVEHGKLADSADAALSAA